MQHSQDLGDSACSAAVHMRTRPIVHQQYPDGVNRDFKGNFFTRKIGGVNLTHPTIMILGLTIITVLVAISSGPTKFVPIIIHVLQVLDEV